MLNIGEVERSAILIKIIALDFIVIKKAVLIPSTETLNKPKEKATLPGEKKGKVSQRNNIKPFTIKMRLKSFLIFNFENITKRKDNNKPESKIEVLFETAIITENNTTTRIFILESIT